MVLVLLAPTTNAQRTPTIELLEPRGEGIGGDLRRADGTRREFHVQATGFHPKLCDHRTATDAAARELAPGSAAEAELLALLQSWCDATFSAEQRRILLAAEQLPAPRSDDEMHANWRAMLLRAVHLYAGVTRPAITKIFAGRGTVDLSLQLQLGDGEPQQVLWRRVGGLPFARLHVGDDVDPVVIDSDTENRLLAAMANWLAARLGGAEHVWQPVAEGVPGDVRLVAEAYRAYMTATSPRLRQAALVMDGGSKVFDVTDAQNVVTHVRFLHPAGHMYDGRKFVWTGSEREAELLAMLTKAAELRRGRLGCEGDADRGLVMLERCVAEYRTKFVQTK